MPQLFCCGLRDHTEPSADVPLKKSKQICIYVTYVVVCMQSIADALIKTMKSHLLPANNMNKLAKRGLRLMAALRK